MKTRLFRRALVVPAWVLVCLASTSFGEEATTASAPSQVDPTDSVLNSERFSFRAEEVPIKQALALFARANNLTIVPDLDVVGDITVEFHDLPLDLAMRALLEASGYYFVNDKGLIRVRSQETRLFHLDYIQVTRAGQGSNAVQISSGGAASGGSSSGASEGSTMTVTNDSSIDFWASLTDQLKAMVGETGRVTINSLAGTVLVSDSHKNIEIIGQYLDSISESVVRQVDLEVQIYEVAFSNAFQLGIDWSRVGKTAFRTFDPARPDSGLIVRNPAYGPGIVAPTLSGSQEFGENVSAVLEALAQQGDLKVVSKPRLRTLNNQPAVVRVGQDIPVFIRQVTSSSGDQPIITANEEIQTVTVGTVLSIIPQVSPDGIITLDITPAVSRLVRTEISASGETSAPVIDIRQASSIVRLRDGDTVVMGGLVQDSEYTTKRKIPLLGDIPILGRAFTGEAKSTERTELVFFLTPRIVADPASRS